MYKLTITNIGALSGTHEFDFGEGISALVGPNGCGKSTVVGALFFAITGETLNHCTFDSMLSWGHESGSVKFSSNNISIIRTIILGKPQKAVFKRTVNGQVVELTRQDDINDAVMTAFNIIDKSAFRQVFFAEQFKAIELLDTSNSKRLEILAALLGLSRFEKFRSAIASASSSVFTERVGQALIDNLSERLTSTTSSIRTLTEDLSGLRTVPDAEINYLKQACLLMTKEEFYETSKRIEEVDKRLEEDRKSLSTLPEPPTEQEIVSLSQAKRLNELREELSSLSEREQRAIVPVVPSTEKIQALINKILTGCASIDAKKEAVQNRLNLLNNGKCPVTGGEPCSDLVKFVNPSLIKTEIDELDEKRRESEKDLSELNDMLKTAQKKEYENSLVISECSKLRRQIEDLKDFSNVNVEALDERVRRLSEHTIQREALLKEITSLEHELEELTRSVQGLSVENLLSTEEKRKLLEDIPVYEESSRRKLKLETELNSAVREKEQIEKSVKLVNEQNERAERGEQATTFLSQVRGVLHKDNLPALLVTKFRNNINTRLAMYLERFDFPYTSSWLADGSIVYNSELGDFIPASSLSGGQKYQRTTYRTQTV